MYLMTVTATVNIWTYEKEITRQRTKFHNKQVHYQYFPLRQRGRTYKNAGPQRLRKEIIWDNLPLRNVGLIWLSPPYHITCPQLMWASNDSFLIALSDTQANCRNTHVTLNFCGQVNFERILGSLQKYKRFLGPVCNKRAVTTAGTTAQVTTASAGCQLTIDFIIPVPAPHIDN